MGNDYGEIDVGFNLCKILKRLFTFPGGGGHLGFEGGAYARYQN